MVQLIPANRKKVQIPKRITPLFIAGALLLSVVLLANSSSGGLTAFTNSFGSGIEAFVSVPDSGEYESENNLAQGKFLVAGRKLDDPNFYRTVVLLIRYGRNGASGLVINRPLNLKIAAAMPEIKELEQHQENLYLGGPVGIGRIMLLIKSAAKPEDSIPVFSDVYISSSLKELKRLVKSTDKGEKFRIYAGYAGWAPGQLESECDRGDWHVLKADARTLFDKKSSEIWPELIHRISTNWVYLDTHDGSIQ